MSRVLLEETPTLWVMATSHSCSPILAKKSISCPFHLSLPLLPNCHSFPKTLPGANIPFLSSFKQLVIAFTSHTIFDPWKVHCFYVVHLGQLTPYHGHPWHWWPWTCDLPLMQARSVPVSESRVFICLVHMIEYLLYARYFRHWGNNEE